MTEWLTHPRIWRIGDDVLGEGGITPVDLSNDRVQDPDTLAARLFEDARPDLAAALSPGDWVLAGRNFAHGRLHIQPLMALQHKRITILAQSIAYHAYRRFVSMGVPIHLVDGEVDDCDLDGVEFYGDIEPRTVTVDGKRICYFTPVSAEILDAVSRVRCGPSQPRHSRRSGGANLHRRDDR